MACFSQHFQAKAVKGRQGIVHIWDVSEVSTFSCVGTVFAHFGVSCYYLLLRNIYCIWSLQIGWAAGNSVSYERSAVFYEEYLPG